MRNKVRKALIACIIPATFFTQNTDTQPTIQDDKCVTEGTFILDAYYGGPFIAGINLPLIGPTHVEKTKTINTNHIGGKVEYMISSIVGIGLEYTYAKATLEYTDTYTSGASTKTGQFYTSLIKHRALAKVNFHFSTTKHLDAYANMGVGLKIIELFTNNPNVNQAELHDYRAVYNLIPISTRVGVGLRYYFSSNFGISAEVGVGGPLGQIGITTKF